MSKSDSSIRTACSHLNSTPPRRVKSRRQHLSAAQIVFSLNLLISAAQSLDRGKGEGTSTVDYGGAELETNHEADADRGAVPTCISNIHPTHLLDGSR